MFDVGHAALVARTELRRRWRSTRGNALQVAALGVAGLFYLVFVAAGTVGGYAAGRALARGDVANPLRGARYAAAAVLVFPAFVVGFRTLARLGNVDALDGLLTTIPHEDLLGGLALSEAAWLGALGGGALLPAAVALAVGSGSVALAAASLVAVAFLGAVGVALGVALGFAARVALSRSAFVARNRTALGLLALLAYLGALTTGRFDDALAPVLEATRRSPAGWFADLALLPVAGDASPALAATAVVGGALVVGGCFAASSRLAAAYWYGDAARPGPDEASDREEARLAGAVTGGVVGGLGLPRPVARIAHKSWLRALRAPVKLVYVVYPLFVLVGPLSDAVQAGAVPATLPALVALYGAWATGAAFTLNPLGDEGAVLPVTLTTPVEGRSFVAGLLVAGGAVGVPVTLAVTAGLGVASPLSPLRAAAVAAAAGVLAVAGPAVAAATGTAFPKFEASNVTRSRQAVVPSLYAFGAFSLALSLVWLPVGATTAAGDAVAEATGARAATVTLAGAALTVTLAAVAGWLSFRYAARGFDGFRL